VVAVGIDDTDTRRRGVVLLSANNWDDLKYADRHLAERLSELTRVLFVDPPMSRLTPRNKPALRKALDRPHLRWVTPTIARLTPVVAPWPERPIMLPLTRLLMCRRIVGAIRELDLREATIVATSPLGVRLSRLSAPLKVYWAQDDFVGGAQLFGIAPARIQRNEMRLVRDADLVIAGTPGVYDTWRARGLKPMLIPYGCDAQAYAHLETTAQAPDVRLSAPIVGFVGVIGTRIDLTVLEAIAMSGHSLLLVGPSHMGSEQPRFDRLVRRTNVQWVGSREFDELPGYLRAMSVGVVPYADTAFNRGSFPLKTLEYLAAGLPVVATGLPATRWLNTQLVRIANEPGAFLEAVESALSEQSTAALVAARRAFARQHDWGVRAAAFLDAFTDAEGRGSTRLARFVGGG
jgi:teichuronic acid biosynthesis glycosyltransferase TuaH